MARKDVTDVMVLAAYLHCKTMPIGPLTFLAATTGEHPKVCYRAMERTMLRGYIDYGVSLNTGFLTPEGRAFLEKTLKESEDAANENGSDSAVLPVDGISTKV